MARERPNKSFGEVLFYPLTHQEHNLAMNRGAQPVHMDYLCGACGQSTNGRVICDLNRTSDQSMVAWCMCSCPKEEPTIIVWKDRLISSQLPISRTFVAHDSWPPELAALYEEAAKSYSASAFTAAVMVCRKLLMACACHEGDADGKTFAQYVDFVTGTVLTFPRAKASLDAIRSIGNDANHNVAFVNQADAERAMKIVTYMLDTIYSLPTA